MKRMLCIWHAGCCCRPFTGAWIETCKLDKVPPLPCVAPSRGRGLKHSPEANSFTPPKSPLHGGVD